VSAAALDASPAHTPAATRSEDELDALAEQLVAAWPALDADRKRELGRLLAAS